jgi:hypothetical protein
MSKTVLTTKGVVIVVALTAVLVAGIIITIVLLLGRNQTADGLVSDIPLEGRGTVALPENIDDIMAQRDEPVAVGYYNVTMTNDWVFDTWNSPSQNALVENSTINNHTVYFDLVLPDTEELIYSSPYIPVGARIESIILEKELPAGEYHPVVIYHLVDEEGNVLDTVSVRITLRILG